MRDSDRDLQSDPRMLSMILLKGLWELVCTCLVGGAWLRLQKSLHQRAIDKHMGNYNLSVYDVQSEMKNNPCDVRT